MESAINLDHIKELLYFYSISDRNSKSFLNKNLEKEKYTSLIQETCIELFKRDYHIGIIFNEQGEYCESYPEKIVILESEKREEEKNKKNNEIITLETIRKKIFKNEKNNYSTKNDDNNIDNENNNNNKNSIIDNNSKLNIKRKIINDEEDGDNIINSEDLSPKKTQKNRFWEEKRNSELRHDDKNDKILLQTNSQSHIHTNLHNKNVTWDNNSIVSHHELTKKETKFKDNSNVSFESKNYNKNQNNNDSSFSLVSYGFLNSSKKTHSLDDDDDDKLKDYHNNFNCENDQNESHNPNNYVSSYSDEIPFVMDDISMDFLASDEITESRINRHSLEDHIFQYNHFKPTTASESVLNDIPKEFSKDIPSNKSTKEQRLAESSINNINSLSMNPKSSSSIDDDFSDWTLTQIKSSLSNLSINNSHSITSFSKNKPLPNKEFFKPTININESIIHRNSSESSINLLLENKSLKALLDYNLYTPTMDSYDNDSCSSNDSYNVMDDLEYAICDELPNDPTTSKNNKSYSKTINNKNINDSNDKNIISSHISEDFNGNEINKNISDDNNKNNNIKMQLNTGLSIGDEVKKVNNTGELKILFMKSKLSRVRSRFVIPVILYKNKNICRSGTLSLEPEMLLNTLNSKTKQIIYGISSENPEAETSFRKSIIQYRQFDIELLNKLHIKGIADLMVENKKIKYGLTVSSSEKCEPSGQYLRSGIHLIIVPYPGSEYFRNFKYNHFCAKNLKVDWSSSFINSELKFPLYNQNYLNINWIQYKSWDFIQLTQNYMKLFVNLLQQKSTDVDEDPGLLVHCISGWDRTPLFISLLRLSLWADGEIHTSLNPEEILYLTIGYDWFSFCWTYISSSSFNPSPSQISIKDNDQVSINSAKLSDNMSFVPVSNSFILSDFEENSINMETGNRKKYSNSIYSVSNNTNNFSLVSPISYDLTKNNYSLNKITTHPNVLKSDLSITLNNSTTKELPYTKFSNEVKKESDDTYSKTSSSSNTNSKALIEAKKIKIPPIYENINKIESTTIINREFKNEMDGSHDKDKELIFPMSFNSTKNKIPYPVNTEKPSININDDNSLTSPLIFSLDMNPYETKDNAEYNEANKFFSLPNNVKPSNASSFTSFSHYPPSNLSPFSPTHLPFSLSPHTHINTNETSISAPTISYFNFNFNTQNSPSSSSSSSSTFSNSYNQYRIRRNSQTNLDVLRFRNHMSYNSRLNDRNYLNPTPHYSLISYYEGRKPLNQKTLSSASSPNDQDTSFKSSKTSNKTLYDQKLLHQLQKNIMNTKLLSKKKNDKFTISRYTSTIKRQSPFYYDKTLKSFIYPKPNRLIQNNNNFYWNSEPIKKHFHLLKMEHIRRLGKTISLIKSSIHCLKISNKKLIDQINTIFSQKENYIHSTLKYYLEKMDIKKTIKSSQSLENSLKIEHKEEKREEERTKSNNPENKLKRTISYSKTFEMVPSNTKSMNSYYYKKDGFLWTCPCCSDSYVNGDDRESKQEALYYYRIIYGLTEDMEDCCLPSYLLDQIIDHDKEDEDHEHESRSSKERSHSNLKKEYFVEKDSTLYKKKLREYRLKAVRQLFQEARLWALNQQNDKSSQRW
ncbi:phosphatases II [Neocallimastix sp. 'constans']